MAFIDTLPADGSWVAASPSPLTLTEIWQVKQGSVLVSQEATPTDKDGIRLEPFDWVRIVAGKSVKIRKAPNYDGAVLVSRESFE